MVYVSFVRRMLLPHKRLLALVLKCLLILIVIRVVSYHEITSLKMTLKTHVLDHPMLLYVKYHVNGSHVAAFSSVCCCSLRLLSLATAPSPVQLTRVTSTPQNCCSSQRFLCFFLDFESDISIDTVDLTRDW
jgi:hypothetical protein